MTVTTRALFDMLKRRYPPWKVLSTVAKDNPGFGMVAKDTSGGGLTMDYGVEYSVPTRAATFATAQTNSSRTRNARFQLDFADDYGVVQIEQKLLESGRRGEDALISALTSQTEGILTALKNSLGRAFFGNGSNQIGVVDVTLAAPVAGPVLQLESLDDVVHFDIGQTLVVAASTTAALRAGTLLVSGIDEILGRVTMTGNLNAGIAAIADGDVIFTQGDYVSAADRLAYTGLDGWIPNAVDFAATPTLFGFNRSVNRTGLAGYAFNDTTYPGYSEEEAVQLLARFIGRGGGTLNCAFMSHERLTRLVNAVGSKEEFVKTVPVKNMPKSEAELGYDGIRIRTPSGLVECYADRNCPNGTIYAGDIAQLKMISIGQCPHWITDPGGGSTGRTMESAAAQEMRLTAWPQLAIRRPRSWGRFDWA